MRRLTLASLILSIFALGALGACKSGLGERCQVNSDCEDNLVCGRVSSTCQESPEGTMDASVDAAVDASEADAPPDAPTDAMEIDAPTDAPIDAP